MSNNLRQKRKASVTTNYKGSSNHMNHKHRANQRLNLVDFRIFNPKTQCIRCGIDYKFRTDVDTCHDCLQRDEHLSHEQRRRRLHMEVVTI